MPYYILTLLLIVADFVLAIITIKSSKKMGPTILLFAAIVSTAASLFQMEIPKPEIFTTNGDSVIDNEVYIKVEIPLKVFYTTVPYEDPQNGKKYEGAIPVENSMTISAKSTLFGIRWSELTSLDIVIGNNQTIDVIDDVEPGSSVKEISAILVKDRFFPGEEISKSDLRVEGTTISGEQVIIWTVKSS